jgi:hypothetical protein
VVRRPFGACAIANSGWPGLYSFTPYLFSTLPVPKLTKETSRRSPSGIALQRMVSSVWKPCATRRQPSGPLTVSVWVTKFCVPPAPGPSACS